MFGNLCLSLCIITTYVIRLLTPPGTPVFPSSEESESRSTSLLPRSNTKVRSVSTTKASRVCISFLLLDSFSPNFYVTSVLEKLGIDVYMVSLFLDWHLFLVKLASGLANASTT